MHVNAGTGAVIKELIVCETSLASSMTESPWHPITSAPFDCDLELAVVDRNDTTLLCFVAGGRGPAGSMRRLANGLMSIRPTGENGKPLAKPECGHCPWRIMVRARASVSSGVPDASTMFQLFRPRSNSS